VLELSSFQLDLLQNSAPDIAVLLNITPDHLDRHGDMHSYCAAKKKIFATQNDCLFQKRAVICIDDNYTQNIYNELARENTISISSIDKNSDIFVNDGVLYDNLSGKSHKIPYNANLQGGHNMINIAASYVVCSVILGMDVVDFLCATESFSGLEHRMQYVGCIKTSYGCTVQFYNDSKATNADASIHALSAFSNIYWLAGGRAKDGGINSLVGKYTTSVRKAYLYGEAAENFARSLHGVVQYQVFSTMKEAMLNAYNDAQLHTNDSTVLLSPSCSSLDQYKNYEERGMEFMNIAHLIMKHL
jgi:UDP-N-acetylmuramoylalanine--D-glutamate ligase